MRGGVGAYCPRRRDLSRIPAIAAPLSGTCVAQPTFKSPSIGALRSTVTMAEDTEDIRTQIERCRRIASQMTDDQIRHSLEELAQDYEERLGSSTGGFMLQDS